MEIVKYVLATLGILGGCFLIGWGVVYILQKYDEHRGDK